MFIGYIICGFLVFAAIMVSLFAEVKVQSTFKRYSEMQSSLPFTGCEIAEKLAMKNNISLTIRSCRGNLTDHYNPKDKSINISEENYNSSSIASQAIVAHEFGHALQDEEDYFPFKVRQAVVKVSNLFSKLLVPMIILGLLFELFWFAGVGNIIIYVYVGIYSVAVIVNLVTLPVEFNASSRAKILLYEMGCSSQEEVAATDKLLNSAAMTYVASLLVSVAYLLRILYILRIFNSD